MLRATGSNVLPGPLPNQGRLRDIFCCCAVKNNYDSSWRDRDREREGDQHSSYETQNLLFVFERNVVAEKVMLSTS